MHNVRFDHLHIPVFDAAQAQEGARACMLIFTDVARH